MLEFCYEKLFIFQFFFYFSIIYYIINTTIHTTAHNSTPMWIETQYFCITRINISTIFYLGYTPHTIFVLQIKHNHNNHNI